MTEWLDAALAYGGRWIDYQLQATEQPGCVVAVAKGGKVVWERAFGVADLRTGDALTTAHRFRVASHSKTFTAVGIMKLQEAGRLHLDDRIGTHVPGLHALVAETTIAQLLAHASGLMRDGTRSPHWQVRAPFFDAAALRAELALPLVLDANSRFKYSNLGFGLLGLAIEAITGEPYASWIAREVVGASGLADTAPDTPLGAGAPLATGHSNRLPFGRGALGGDQPTFALAAATGFVSTAGDLARFFASLDPAAETSVLSVASRREMTRRHWEVPHQSESRHYGLGTMIGQVDGHTLIGHGGSFPGFISRSATVPDWGIGLSVVTNAIDGPANAWLDGLVSILHQFASHGAPSAGVAGWSGRWWNLWRVVDLVPMGDLVLAADPAGFKPFADATEIEITGPDRGRVRLANGFASHGEGVERSVDASGTADRLFVGGSELVADPKDLAVSYETPA
ncbi:serine hydrolase domain-containing protein [Inquilinus limosus]|uniref:Beta lactamase n=1 Tax=Inquilinus limosus MP06 TaxID=1398085 RepID=A0A0A0DA53_9PROT|nr:serine hydrolase domain-containing protein [Inquilinus limosus]KGM34880.1 beta lactamase [Inquilinus limosus MP06]